MRVGTFYRCWLERVGTFFMFDKKEMTYYFTGHITLSKGKEKQVFDKTKAVVIGLIEKAVQ